ncbi:hypothetical protein VTK26DRAFT_1283 [Humicola hyalothermophila]
MSDPLIQLPQHAVDLGSLKSKTSQDQRQQKLGPFRLSRVIRRANNTVLSWRDGLSESEREQRKGTEEMIEILTARMLNAETYRDWKEAAKELDHLEGNDAWKLDDWSGDYQPELIRARLQALDEARENQDIEAMVYLIRTTLSRDLGGMGNIDLYRHSYIGTKRLVERYIKTVCTTIEFLVERSAVLNLDPGELRDDLTYARQSFGRSALLLSGGATFGMSHIGVLKTLFEAKLLPRIISGASAGSIVASVVCTRKDEDIPPLIQGFPFGDLGVFEGEGESFTDHVRRLLTEGSWSNIENLTRVMRSWLGDVTFQEAYNRTRRICNICVSTASAYELPRLLNYITAPDVLIWSAVTVSCTVPLIYQSVPLLMKDRSTGELVPWNPTPQRLIDGSVDGDLPMTRLAELFNVNHFIVSQVNPHIVPFLAKDDQLHPANAPGMLREKRSSGGPRAWLASATTLAKEEGLHRMHCLAEMGILPNLLTKLRSVLSQKYCGDITILPEIPVRDMPLILKNPTPEFMIRNCLLGERATWPKLSRIRDRLAIEIALDQAVHKLRARVAFSKSQADLRRSTQYWKRGIVGASSSGEGTPEEGLLGRRRGSGSSIQLLVTSGRGRSFRDDEDDDSEDDGLELKVRPGRSSSRPQPKPRLKRSAKSHGHMRSGKPASQSPRGELKLPAYDFLEPLAREKEAGNASGPAKAESSQGSSAALLKAVSEYIGDALLGSMDNPSQSSDNGPTSDSDIYAGPNDETGNFKGNGDESRAVSENKPSCSKDDDPSDAKDEDPSKTKDSGPPDEESLKALDALGPGL